MDAHFILNGYHARRDQLTAHVSASNYPHSKGEIKQIIAEDNYVLLHVHEVLEPGTSGVAVAEIFRLDHGKVVAHWDVTQDVPEQSENPNGMF